MSRVIAVAGGSGQLGRAIVDAIRNDGKYEVVVLGRKSADESETKARTIGVDYTDVGSLVKTLQSNRVHTVISTINVVGDRSSEINLTKAAERSECTKRYIPATWGVEYTEDMEPYFPIAADKRVILAALKQTSLQWTNVVNGYFADFFTSPRVPSYIPQLATFIDPLNDVAVIPGSGETKVAFTHTWDIARYVSRLMDEEEWDETSFIVGSKVTFNELLRLFEEAKGTEFRVSHDSIDTLRQGKITELPSHPQVYPFFPKEEMQPMFAAFGRMYDEGVFDLKPEKSLNERFPEIRARSMRELVEAAWGKE